MAYRSNNIGSAMRLINILRSMIGRTQIIAGLKEISEIIH